MRSRLALLALLVIAMMTAPGVRADFVARGQAQLAQRDDRLAVQGASKRQSLHSERRGSTSRSAHAKSGSLALVPSAWLWLRLPVSVQIPTLLLLPQDASYHGPRRARAPPSVA